jgi:hypothetical protein
MFKEHLELQTRRCKCFVSFIDHRTFRSSGKQTLISEINELYDSDSDLNMDSQRSEDIFDLNETAIFKLTNHIHV